MNRLENLVDQDLAAELIPAVPTPEPPLAPAASLDRTSHCIFTPLHYERNYAYPLVVWLHGDNGDEREVTRVMPLVSMRNYVGVGLRGTQHSAGGGYGWQQVGKHIARAEHGVWSAISAARRWLNIAPDRIFLAGHGCGGTMALRIALGAPRDFAGVISLGGAFPSSLRPLAHLNELRQLKVFLGTGRDSVAYPQEEVCRTLKLFHAGGMRLNLWQYPCGDELLSNMFTDIDRWMMEQIIAPEPIQPERPAQRSPGKPS